jgi:DNA-binding beta-propeller fold protein YncE
VKGFKERAGLGLVVAIVLALLAAPASAAAFGPLSGFGSNGQAAGELDESGSLAIAPDGSVYVADYSNSRISVFSPDGGFQFAFGEGVAPGGGNVCTASTGCVAGNGTGDAGALNEPESLAFDSSGRVFVVEYSNNRVSAFSPQGQFLYAFGGEVNAEDHSGICDTASGCEEGTQGEDAGELDSPSGIAVVGEDVFVADSGNNRISVFGTDGAFRYAFGSEVNPVDDSDVCDVVSGCQAGDDGSGAGEMGYPYDVKPTADGRLVISDSRNQRLDIYSKGGAFQEAFGKGVNDENGGDVCNAASGCREGETDESAGSLDEPTALSVDSSGDIYVGDTGYDRVAEFSAAGAFVKAWGAGVLNGEALFQVCTTASGCVAGLEDGRISGATTNPYGVAADCGGGVYVSEEESGFAHVERFGESGSALPPCPAVAPPPATPIAAPAAPSNRFKFGKLKLNRKKGTALLIVKVPDPGRLVLRGKGIKKVKRAAKHAGNVKLPVRLVGKAKKKLAKTGTSKVTARVTFTPNGGKSLTKKRKLKLKEKPKRKKKQR